MDGTFVYTHQGRRPGTYFVLWVWLLMAMLAREWGAPPAGWGVLAFVGTWLGWWLCVNPVFGLRLSEGEWQMRAGRHRLRVPLHRIDRLVQEQDGPRPGYRLYLTDGTCTAVPGRCLPPRARIEPVLRRRGIRILDAAPVGRPA